MGEHEQPQELSLQDVYAPDPEEPNGDEGVSSTDRGFDAEETVGVDTEALAFRGLRVKEIDQRLRLRERFAWSLFALVVGDVVLVTVTVLVIAIWIPSAITPWVVTVLVATPTVNIVALLATVVAHLFPRRG